MNKHLDTFRFPTRTKLVERTAAEVKSMWCLEAGSVHDGKGPPYVCYD
eukprot:COSAG02_NODE_16491_length_1079_cov_1.526531_2_plen_47_part_01